MTLLNLLPTFEMLQGGGPQRLIVDELAVSQGTVTRGSKVIQARKTVD